MTEKTEEEKQQSRRALMLYGIGCAVLVFLFGCLPFAAVGYFYLL